MLDFFSIFNPHSRSINIYLLYLHIRTIPRPCRHPHKRIVSRRKRTLGRQSPRNFPSILQTRLSHQRSMENESILWGVVFCFKSSEEGFFGSEDLDCGGGLFGEINEIACMSD